MTRVLLLLLLLLAGPGLAGAQPLPPGLGAADRVVIQDVITRQLDAFRHDDGPGAYRFAAPAIKRMFPSPEVFLDMVQRGYRPVYRARDAEFGALAPAEGAWEQTVELIGPDGQAAQAIYTMERDGAGGWVIAGVRLLPSGRVGT